MGLTYCKSLFSKSKTETSPPYQVNGQPSVAQPANAADFQISTVQNALDESQETTQTIATASVTHNRTSDAEENIEKIACNETVVIVGGGPCSQTCAENLRQNGFLGRIVMVCKERFLPYDRSRLSKFMNTTIEEAQLRNQTFYDENKIEVLLNVKATSLNTSSHEINLDSGKIIKYNKLFIATGSRPRRPNIPGVDLKNIFNLRDINEANEINLNLKKSSRVVILGSSFIAMEAAAYCVDKVAKVTIIGRGSVPLAEEFGESIGNRIMKMFESQNIQFIMHSGIDSFMAINQEEALSAVKLIDGQILKADLCIFGIGSELNTEFLHDSGLTVNSDGSIDTNSYLETNIPNIYVGGDIANSPIFTNQRSTIGHYALAQYHGKIAALNMIGMKTELKAVPYFFTVMFGKCITYTGHGSPSEIFIEGDLESMKFVAFYFDEAENVIGMASSQPDKSIAEFAEKLSQGQRFVKNDLSKLFDIDFYEDIKKSDVSKEEEIEKIVCNESELEDNSMREVEMEDEKKILLIKQNGKISAIGAKCGHYGAPLVMGALGEGRVRCPFHGACFNIETGDIEEFPGLDSIPCFQVKVEEGVVKVRAKKSDLKSDRRIQRKTSKVMNSNETFVIVGGGPSGQTCAETLRQNGYHGRIIMICKENFLPYDRVRVSKAMNKSIDDIQLRPKTFYDDNKIETFLNTEAVSLNASKNEITLSSNDIMKYDRIFIATGSRARKPNVPGSELKNIFTLRNINDANEIEEKLTSKSHVVILGSSFIGMESAAYCADKVAKVTIIGKHEVPLKELFGEAIGKRIMKLFESKNVEFLMRKKIKAFVGIENLVGVELTDGSKISADICIMGIGSELNTEFLHDSGLTVNSDGSIDTNSYLETNIPNIYVGGDIANSPIFTNQRSTIGHYALAQYHGKIAALNMIGMKTELKAVPYFFTVMFGKCITYTGHGSPSEIFIEGDLESMKFVAFYFDEAENVIGMASCQPDKSIAEFAEKLTQGYKFHKNDIEWVNEN
ncbi:CLUMA_CG006079, isoform A, partial [Clunio marinus]